MKKIVLFSVFALLLSTFSSFAQDNDNDNDNDGGKPRIQGSGHVITKDIPVKSFD
jgi:hypothetical protein